MKRETNPELLDDKDVQFKVESVNTPEILQKDFLKKDSAVKLLECEANLATQGQLKDKLKLEVVQENSISQTLSRIEEISNTTESSNEFNMQREKVESSIIDNNFESDESHLGISEEPINGNKALKVREEESMIPSAPAFEEETIAFVTPQVTVEPEFSTKVVKTTIQCMALEDAVRVFGGKEIYEVREISQKEEAIVETGPISGPEHPLVDLLVTFR